MTKRRLVMLAALAAAVGLAGMVGWWAMTPPPLRGVNLRIYKRIQEGMTRAEVEAVIAMPPGYYDRNKAFENWTTCHEQWGQFGDDQDAWVTDRGVLVVAYSPEGVVCGKVIQLWMPVDAPFLEGVRRWLGL